MIYVARQTNFFLDSDKSNKPQRFHTKPTARAGGIGIFVSGTLAILISSFNWGFALAGFLAFLSGIIEDLKGTLSPKMRLGIHFLSALAGILLLNAVITDVGLDIKLPYALGFAFTIVAVIGSINSINIIDGFNGLAGGIAVMVLSSLACVAYMVGDLEVFQTALIIIAAILGFLFLNFPSGKIFLGDGGAYFLGFVIVELAIILSQRNADVSAWFVLCIMIYPVYEVLFSIYRRKVFKNLSPVAPDRTHLHSLLHKRKTRNNPKTSAWIWAFNLPFIFLPIFYHQNDKFLMLTILVFIVVYNLFYYALVNFKVRSKQKSHRTD